MTDDAPDSPARSALTRFRVFDGTGLTAPTTVVLDGGHISADTSTTGAEIIDGHGAVLLPGLIETHVHLLGGDDLSALAAAGITTALDMACWPPEKVDALRGHTPDIRSAGIPAIGPGGNHARMPGMPPEAILTDPAQAAAFVQGRIAEGSDYIKIVIEGELLDQATIDAVASHAREHGKRCVAHASSVRAYRTAVHAGVDIVTHVPRDGVIDPDTIARMLTRGIVASPTLTMMQAVTTQLPTPGDAYSHSRDSVAALHTAGVPIMAGTDAFAAPMLPEPIGPGPSLHHELALLVDAGLSTAEALRAATSLPAQHFDLPDRGNIAPGRRADLVLVDGDPLADIRHTRNIVGVWSAGTPVGPDLR